MKKIFIILFFMVFLSCTGDNGVENEIKAKFYGYIKDTEDNPLQGAWVQLGNLKQQTDAKGYYQFPIEYEHHDTLQVTMTGFESFIQVVYLSNLDFCYDVILSPLGDRTVSPNLTIVTAHPPILFPDGISVSVIRVIPKNYDGEPLGTGQTVHLTTTLGTLLDSVDYNSSDKSYTQMIRAPVTEGVGYVSVIVNGISILNKAELHFTSQSGGQEEGIPRFYGYVKDTEGRPLQGAMVELGDLKQQTDATGYFQFPILSQHQVTLKVSLTGYEDFLQVVFLSVTDYRYDIIMFPLGEKEVSAALTSISAEPSSLPPDGISISLIKVIPKNYRGIPLGAGQTVSLSTTMGTLLGAVVYNAGEKSYLQQLIAPATEGTGYVSAVVNDVPILNKAEIHFTTELWINYTTANGLATNTVNALVIDSYGNVWVGVYPGGSLQV